MTAVAFGTGLVPDDRKARRNAVVLAFCQALYTMGAINLYITAGLVGVMLAPSKVLATVPISTYIIGTALSTVPLSMLMKRIGRRPGFLVGISTGVVGALLCVYAIFARDFVLFCLGTAVQGAYQAAAGYYRFAAADVASDRFRPEAISWVMLGGIAAALFGPMIVIASRGLFSPVMFAGNFAVVAGLGLVAMLVVSRIDIPHTRAEAAGSDARPALELLRQPRLVVAVLCGMLSYGMMNLVMTSTPLAMVGCGFTVDNAAFVIQWHALAMYVPSFFTGRLIARVGVERIVALGMALLALAGISGLAGVAFANFAVGLVLLGLGWNFAFVGGTTMVTHCYRASEKNKVQAINDLAVFSTVAVTSMTSGTLMALFGWNAINLALFPMIALCLAALWWLTREERRRRAACA